MDSDGEEDRTEADLRGTEGSDFLPGAEPGALGGHRRTQARATFRSVFAGTGSPLGLAQPPAEPSRASFLSGTVVLIASIYF